MACREMKPLPKIDTDNTDAVYILFDKFISSIERMTLSDINTMQYINYWSIYYTGLVILIYGLYL